MRSILFKGRRGVEPLLLVLLALAIDPCSQTPAIAEAFALDGVVTLVDAKNVLPRLRDGEEEMEMMKEEGQKGADTVDEAFQQIMFSDRIVVNKV